jgi:hypothetical protein
VPRSTQFRTPLFLKTGWLPDKKHFGAKDAMLPLNPEIYEVSEPELLRFMFLNKGLGKLGLDPTTHDASHKTIPSFYSRIPTIRPPLPKSDRNF